MKIVSDLHLHSKYARATSPQMNPTGLAEGAKRKGLNLLGTGDFTHPKYLQELKQSLTYVDSGIFIHNSVYFILSVEISLMYSQDGKGRKVHNLILAPDFETVDQINAKLDKWGRRDYDGRPIFGKTCPELVDLIRGVNEDCEIIPAHIWTPWFSLFGSNSGFNSVKDCFGDTAKHIHALETGMSSDPAMNWRLSQLDDYVMVSFSDSHSPYPWRLGREATVFELDKPNYFELVKALRDKDKKKLIYTIETFPEYGKYHYDGHRECGVSFSPEETRKMKGICPVCRKPLTIGVEYRVEELADRPVGYVPKNAIPFKTLLPLSELIAGVLGAGLASKKVIQENDKLISSFGSELNVLLEAPQKALGELTHQRIAEAVINNRAGKIKVKPGYDGEYGVPLLGQPLPEEKAIPRSQKTLGEF